MALRVATKKLTESGFIFGSIRSIHVTPLPPPVATSLLPAPVSSPPFSLPEYGTRLPGFSFDGDGGPPMDLMAVPKRKVSKHKRGIRNGPKALKPTPVIIRCKSCGKVKLPHFYCCSGRREEPGERNDIN